MSFAPEYVSCVLNDNFEDAKAQFLSPLMAIHYAHLVMLVERGIVEVGDALSIRGALDAIDVDAVRRTRYDGSCEDLFFYVQRLIAAGCGEPAAGRLHIARSRNDIDMTMYRMRQRGLLLRVAGAGEALRHVLLRMAARHRTDVFPAHTHTQAAQPTTIAHYLLAIVEQLERDAVRLQAAYAATNRCPLGSCAITGTGFPVDRSRTAALLGFDGPTGNTYGSIATVDYLLESVSATTILLVGLGRVVQDLLLWCTSGIDFLRLADGYVQCSSIMPQKRNPVALEHARALASKAAGQAAAIVLTVHNTPFGDIVDSEDDLQPLVCTMFRDATRAVRLVAAALEGASFDIARMAQRAAEGWITATELSDTLVREHAVPVRAAYAIAARLASGDPPADDLPLGARFREAVRSVLGEEASIGIDDEGLARILSPAYFVAVRATHGGPAAAETGRAIAESEARLEGDERWRAGVLRGLGEAEGELRRALDFRGGARGS